MILPHGENKHWIPRPALVSRHGCWATKMSDCRIYLVFFTKFASPSRPQKCRIPRKILRFWHWLVTTTSEFHSFRSVARQKCRIPYVGLHITGWDANLLLCSDIPGQKMSDSSSDFAFWATSLQFHVRNPHIPVHGSANMSHRAEFPHVLSTCLIRKCGIPMGGLSDWETRHT